MCPLTRRGVAREARFAVRVRTSLVPRGAPSGAAEIEKEEVCFFFAKRVRVDAQGQFGAGITELGGHDPRTEINGFALLLRVPRREAAESQLCPR